MPKYDLIAEEIKWCEAHRNPEQMVYQDGFIAGLYHALWLMKSRPTPLAVDKCPACRGSGIEKANKKYTIYCVACNGWGIRR